MRRHARALALVAFAAAAWGVPEEMAGPDVPAEARAGFESAEIAREEGRLAEAVAAYEKAIQGHPLYWGAHAGYLESLRGLGDMAPAAPLYAKLVEANPAAVELKAFQAAALPPADAVAALATLAKGAPDNARVLLESGRAHLFAGQWADAERVLRQAMKLHPELLAARILVGDVLLRQGKVASARKEYEAATESEPNLVAAHLRVALCLHRQAKTDKAIESLQRLVATENYPKLAAGHLLLALIYAETDDLKHAIESTDRILAVAPQNLSALLLKGQLQLRGQNVVEAVQTFQKAVEAQPSSATAVFCLGWAQEKSADVAGVKEDEKLKRLESAAGTYRKCADMDPRARVRDSLGFVILLKKTDVGEAVTQFKRARDLDPTFAPALNNVGLTEDMQDKTAEAMKRYEAVLEKIDKKNVRALVMLGLDSWLQGSSPKAIGYLQAALKLDPKDDLAWTFLGDIYLDGRKFKDAVDAFEKATEVNPKNFTAWYHMGNVLCEELRRYEEADRAYRKALDCRADPPVDMLLRLGELNDDDGLDRIEEALKFYEMYVDRGGTTEWVRERIQAIKDQLASGKK